VTTPKINTIKRGGARFYVAEDGVAYPGVTSILGMLPKEFLKYWAAKSVAQTAVDDLGSVVSIALRDPSAAVDYLKRSPDRDVRKSQDTGTAAHSLFERMAKGEAVGRVAPDMEPFALHFGEFLDKVQPEFLFLEETVWSDTHQYAGSFDWLARIEGELVWGDTKTTRSGIHEEVGLQLSAYSNADHILRPDGSRVPMPKSDRGMVFHVRPEGWSLTPVRADRELFETGFLPLRQVFHYEREIKPTIIGDALHKGPAPDAPTTRRRAPRKGASA